MTAIDLNLSTHVSHVEQLDLVIAWGGEEPIAIGIPGHVGTRVLVNIEGGQRLAGLGVPQFDGLLSIFASWEREIETPIEIEAQDSITNMLS